MIIKNNRIRCNHCGEIIESFHRHDYKFCQCGKVSVDGGHAYLKRSFENCPEDDYTELSITEGAIMDEQQYNNGEIKFDHKEDLYEYFYDLGNGLYLDKKMSKKLSDDTSKSLLDRYDWDDDGALWILDDEDILRRKIND